MVSKVQALRANLQQKKTPMCHDTIFMFLDPLRGTCLWVWLLVYIVMVMLESNAQVNLPGFMVNRTLAFMKMAFECGKPRALSNMY